MKNCLIIGASENAYWDNRAETELIICADGGIKNALRLGLTPDITAGDGDSADFSAYGGTKIEFSPEKDFSDTEACIREALRLGAGIIYLVGGTGGRLDHFLANLFLLEFIQSSGAKGIIVDKYNEITVFKNKTEIFPPHRYKYFSVIPFDKEIKELSISGAKYPLYKKTVRRFESLTLSNEPLQGVPVEITATGGTVCLVKSNQSR